MYIPKYFTPKELFPPEIATPQFCVGNWRRFDDRILKMYDQIREDHGIMTGNEGNLTGCGFRFPTRKNSVYNGDTRILYTEYNINTLSQHTFGRAIDGHPKEKTSQEIRFDIIRNPERYPHIKFLEIDISWLHGDCRNSIKGKSFPPKLWSPIRGFVTPSEYLKWGDKQ